MSEKKNEIKKERKEKLKQRSEFKKEIREIIEKLKNRKLEIIIFIGIVITFCFTNLNKYVLYCSDSLTQISSLCMLFLILLFELKIIVTLFREEKKAVVITMLMLLCWCFLDSSKTGVLVFTFVFELVILKLLFNPENSKRKLEGNIKKYNEAKNKNYVFNSDVFDRRAEMSIIIYRLIIYTIITLPMFLYEVIVALGSFKYTVNDIVEKYDIPMEKLNTTVTRITGDEKIDLFIFNYSNFILESYSKMQICMSFMILISGIVIYILMSSESIQENRQLYKERIERDVVKEIRKSMNENKDNNESIIFSDEELICIDEEIKGG